MHLTLNLIGSGTVIHLFMAGNFSFTSHESGEGCLITDGTKPDGWHVTQSMDEIVEMIKGLMVPPQQAGMVDANMMGENHDA